MTTFPSELLPPMTSASQLQTWASCGRKYMAKYVLHLTPEYRSTALVVGSVVHSVLGFHYDERKDGRTVSRELLQRITQADLAAEIAESNLRWKDETPESLEAEVTRLVSLYLDAHENDDVTETEVLFEIALEDPETGEVRGRSLKGYFDFILSDERVVELKTAARAWHPDDLTRHIQVGAYAYAHMTKVGGMSDLDVRVLVKTKTPRIDSFHVARGEPATRWFITAAWAIEEAILSGIFPPSPSPMCGACEYRKACASLDWSTVLEQPPEQSSVRRALPMLAESDHHVLA